MRPIDEAKLTKLLNKYQNPVATKKDVKEVLEAYQALSYQSETYVFNDGKSKELFNLQGTIPVIYKTNTYHIPVCIWLMDTHPDNAPICYVKPTQDMHIKVSMYVDFNGKVYLPYLHEWQPQSSDLLGLIQVMIVIFGDYPPVYSKPKQTPYPSQPYMPQPGGGASYPYQSGAGFPYPAANTNYGPSFPAYPTPSNTNNPYPYPPRPTGYNSEYNANSTGTGTITEEHIKASLISAVEDKMRRRIEEKVNQCQAEIQTLNRTKQELLDGEKKLNEIIKKLQREEEDLKKNILILNDKDSELKQSIESMSNADEIDIDEAVTTTAPLYKQLINAYAEEAAIEDAVYYMRVALGREVIDLDVFLKNVRQLARKQFMLRALMLKCREKAGLTS